MNRSVVMMAALLLPLGQAVAGEWVIGGSLGKAQGDTGAGELNSQLAAMGLNATAGSSEDGRTAWNIYLGYNYTSRLGVEIGYTELGEVTTSFSGTTSDIDTFLTSASAIHPQTAEGWQLSGVYRHLLGKGFKATVSLGAFIWDVDYTLSTTTVSRNVSDHGADIVLGVGMEYEVYQDVNLHADYDLYDVDGEDISLMSLGVSYRLE